MKSKARTTSNKRLDTLSVGFGMSFFIASLFNALLVIVKEGNALLMDGMKALSGHHWTTHGIVVIVLFGALGYFLSKTKLAKTIDATKTSFIVLAGTVAGSLIIMGFFFKNFFE